jgi:hypothetical protein
MTKKDNKKRSSKNHVEEKESCGLSSLKDVPGDVYQKSDDKKINTHDNPINIPSTYSTPRESIFDFFNNLKDSKQQSNKPHSAPQIHNSKNQIYQAPRSSRRTFDRQDTPRPRSQTPPCSHGESNTLRRRSNSKLGGRIQEITSCLFGAIERTNKSTNSKSQITHCCLRHRNQSPPSSNSVSPKASMGRYGSIPKSPHGYRLYNCISSRHECTNCECQIEQNKSRTILHQHLVVITIFKMKILII